MIYCEKKIFWVTDQFALNFFISISDFHNDFTNYLPRLSSQCRTTLLDVTF